MHGITVGALGILSLTIMGRVLTQRTSGLRELPMMVRAAIALVALATITRLLALDPDLRLDMLIWASSAWTLGMALFAVNLVWAVGIWLPQQKAA
jgi:uncharacterized protein involved in response to NO